MDLNNIEINAKTGEIKKSYVEPDKAQDIQVNLKEEYHKLSNKLIRKKYTLDQELSIQRQREDKPDEFQEYFNYCEECKVKAKDILNIDTADVEDY